MVLNSAVHTKSDKSSEKVKTDLDRKVKIQSTFLLPHVHIQRYKSRLSVVKKRFILPRSTQDGLNLNPLNDVQVMDLEHNRNYLLGLWFINTIHPYVYINLWMVVSSSNCYCLP